MFNITRKGNTKISNKFQCSNTSRTSLILNVLWYNDNYSQLL